MDYYTPRFPRYQFLKRDVRLEKLVAHTGLEPVISALRGQRVNQLHQCAVEQRLIIKGHSEGWQTTELPTRETVFLEQETLVETLCASVILQFARPY